MKPKFICLAMIVGLLIGTGAVAQVVVKGATVKGSPYLDETYVDAVVSFATNTRTLPVRYNAYKDLMEYQQNGQSMVLDPAPTIKGILLGDQVFVVEKYEADGKVKSGYFTLLDSGKVDLYGRKEVKFVPGRKGGALDGTDQPAEFKRTPDNYFIKVGEGKLIEVKNIKSMIESFPDKQDELTQFAKKEKISPRDEDELRQLVKYYNEL